MKLNAAEISRHSPPAGRSDYIVFDDTLPGFGLRYRGGRRIWLYQYAFGTGASRVKAPHWRLTELGCMAEPPTRDFMRWDGIVFQEQKKPRRHTRQKQNPVPSDGSGCTAGRDITAYRRTDQSADELYRRAVHTDDGACTVQRDISRVNHSPHLEWTTPVDGSAAVGGLLGARPPRRDAGS